MEKINTRKERKGAVGRSKVKTGCLTCRIRRKKCDEKRPSCSQCSGTDRACDFLKVSNDTGFFHNYNGAMSSELQEIVECPGSTSYKLGPSPTNLIPNVEKFRIMLRKHFSFHFQVELLERLVLQAAHTEPCIRHCITAISHLPLEPANGEVRSASLQSLQQYNLAIQELNKSADGSFEGLALVVITSMFFIYIELLQGSTDNLIMHYISAFTLMKSFLTKVPVSRRNIFGHSFEIDLQNLFIALSRIDVRQSFRLGSAYRFAPSRIPHIPPEFTSIQTARDCLNAVKMRILDIFSNQTHQSPFTVQLEIDLSNINALLGLWNEKFIAFAHSCSPSDVTQNAMLDILRIEFLVSQIEVSTAFLYQSAYDLETSKFQRIIGLAERILELDQDSTHHAISKGPCFMLDIGMVQPLCFVAQKCREPVIRRRAIEVLRKVRKERVPDVQVLVRACNWVVEMEEEGCGLDGIVVEERRFHDFEVYWNCANGESYKVMGRRAKVDGSWEEVFGLV